MNETSRPRLRLRGGSFVNLGSPPKPKMTRPAPAEHVCDMFIPHGTFDEICRNCGHEEKSHNESKVKSKTMRVISDGSTTRLANATSLQPNLEPGTYILQQDQSGMLLENTDSLPMPNKIYGTSEEKSDRILKTFVNRGGRPMGVMCSGRPGTGKTILSKMAANKAVELGYPVIVIRNAFMGSTFANFLETLPSRCVLFIDEVEKIYHQQEARDWLLTAMDGTVSNSHLWLLTSNNPAIGEAFENRPGRIRYHYKFQDVEEEMIDGIIAEMTNEDRFKKEIKEISQKIRSLTPDILVSIIEEVNIHSESPKTFIDYLNINSSLPENFSVEGIVMLSKVNPATFERSVQECENFNEELKKAIIRNFHHYGIEDVISNFEGVEELLPKKETEVSSFYVSQPIGIRNNGKPHISLRVNEVDNMKKDYRVQWEDDEIKSMEIVNGNYIITHIDEKQVLTFKPKGSPRAAVAWNY